MSKYYKAEDVVSKIVNTPTRVITDDLTALADRQHEIIDMLADLPTIDIVHCEECKHNPKRTNDFAYGRCVCCCEDDWYGYVPDDDYIDVGMGTMPQFTCEEWEQR